MKPKDDDSIMALPFDINAKLRYRGLGLWERSTREDVRRVRHLLPQVSGIGPEALSVIDAWLGEAPMNGKDGGAS
jgi:hypothetical protein